MFGVMFPNMVSNRLYGMRDTGPSHDEDQDAENNKAESSRAFLSTIDIAHSASAARSV